MKEPTVYIVIGESACARDYHGEIVETVSWDSDGKPIWNEAGIADHRGGGGAAGYHLLQIALDAAEFNAVACGETIGRVPFPLPEASTLTPTPEAA